MVFATRNLNLEAFDVIVIQNIPHSRRFDACLKLETGDMTSGTVCAKNQPKKTDKNQPCRGMANKRGRKQAKLL